MADRVWQTVLDQPLIGLSVAPLPVPGRRSWPPDSDYSEDFWLPVLGPTTWVLGRLLVRWAHAGTSRLVPAEVGPYVGTPGTPGVNHPLGRAFGRLIRFRLADYHADRASLVVLERWPDVPHKWRAHWTGALAATSASFHGVDR